jgi:hypothetical protein
MGEPKNEAKRRAGGTRRAFTSFKVFFFSLSVCDDSFSSRGGSGFHLDDE